MAAGDQRRLAARFAGRTPKLRVSVHAGTTATTNIAVTGIKHDDVIVSVLLFASGVPSDITAETSITSDGNVQTATTNTTGDTVVVIWFQKA